MYWILLIIAGLFEVAWAIGLKYSDGFTKTVPSILTIIGMIISMGLLGFVVKKIPVGTAYAVWSGIGAIGTVILGMILFDESKSVSRLLFLSLIFIGIIGLKVIGIREQ